MNIELINTGSELLWGLILNSHQQWICDQFRHLGHAVARQTTVPDSGPVIQEVVRDALSRSDLVLVTGGLGPTSDDQTRDRIAELIGRPLRLDPEVQAHIEQFFRRRGRPMPESTRVQAQVPEGARVLPNAQGTAPGLILELDANPFREGNPPAWIIMLPGPFRELRPMFLEQVLPYLKEHLRLGEAVVCRILKCFGLGESYVQEQIADPLKPYTDSGLELGYCARAGEVEVRLVAPKQQADNLLPEAEKLVRTQLGAAIFGMDDDTLESVVVRRLTERKEMLVLAESCTGGAVANRLTHVPGASEVLWGGLVTYHNHAKHQLLGVKEETLATHGAVSEPVARQMAEGARHRYHAAFGLAITGIAGPGGGTPEKPVGTVYLATATADETIVHHFVNRYDRLTFKQITTNQALDLLRRQL